MPNPFDNIEKETLKRDSFSANSFGGHNTYEEYLEQKKLQAGVVDPQSMFTYGQFIDEQRAKRMNSLLTEIDLLTESISLGKYEQLAKDINLAKEQAFSKNHTEVMHDQWIGMFKTCIDTLMSEIEHVAADDKTGKLQITIDEEDKTCYERASRLLSDIDLVFDESNDISRGTLQIPDKDIKVINDRRVFRVNASKRASKYSPVRSALNPDTFHTQDEFEEKKIADDVPLFDGMPKPADVQQGFLGDCYLLSSLLSISAQDPTKITEAMRDNNDGTVTVRFYTNFQQPVYVTVDKSVAVLKNPDNPARKGKAVYSQDRPGSLWVQMIEKAYAASGLAQSPNVEDKLDDAVKGREIDYTSIRGGFARYFISQFIGLPEWSDEQVQYFATANIATSKGPDYSKEELDFFNTVKTKFDEGHIITAGSQEKYDPNEPVPDAEGEKAIESLLLREQHKTEAAGNVYTEQKRKEDRIRFREAWYINRDIVKTHAYSISGIEKDEQDGKIYVKFTNPHRQAGLIQTTDEKGNVVNRGGGNKGYGRVELRLFNKLFRDVVIFKNDLSAYRKERAPEAESMVHRYGDTVEKIQKSLADADNIFMAVKNSDFFKKFKAAANKAVTAIHEEYPDPDAIDKSMRELFATAKAYENYCTDTKRIDLSTDSERAVKRYKASKITAGLADIYEQNEPEDRSYLSRKNAEFKQKLECEYGQLSIATRIPTTGWEQIVEASTSVAEKLQKLNTPQKRSAYFEKVNSFLENNKHVAFTADKIKKLDEASKNEYFKENRNDLETMIAITTHGDEILNMMKTDGYDERHQALVNELNIKRDLLQPIAKSTLAATDSLLYAGKIQFASKEGHTYKDHLDNLFNEANESLNQIDRFNKTKQKEQSKQL